MRTGHLVDADICETVNGELWELVQKLTKMKYTVWIVLPLPNGKGYLSTIVYEPTELGSMTSITEHRDEVVLFVFGFDPKLHVKS